MTRRRTDTGKPIRRARSPSPFSPPVPRRRPLREGTRDPCCTREHVRYQTSAPLTMACPRPATGRLQRSLIPACLPHHGFLPNRFIRAHTWEWPTGKDAERSGSSTTGSQFLRRQSCRTAVIAFRAAASHRARERENGDPLTRVQAHPLFSPGTRANANRFRNQTDDLGSFALRLVSAIPVVADAMRFNFVPPMPAGNRGERSFRTRIIWHRRRGGRAGVRTAPVRKRP